MNLFGFAVGNARREFGGRMFDSSRDPIERDPFVIQQRADEAEREQRWNEFVAFVQQARVPTLLRHIADLMEGRRDPYYIATGVQDEILGFQETEQWHGVISAIGQALRQAEADAQEVEKRR